MKLYHASKYKFDTIKRQQASHPSAEDFAVPESELQNKIYFTPDLGFAIAMAAGPDGMTSLRNGQVSFEHYDEFDAERLVYVYEIDSESIPPELIEEVDGVKTKPAREDENPRGRLVCAVTGATRPRSA